MIHRKIVSAIATFIVLCCALPADALLFARQGFLYHQQAGNASSMAAFYFNPAEMTLYQFRVAASIQYADNGYTYKRSPYLGKEKFTTGREPFRMPMLCASTAYSILGFSFTLGARYDIPEYFSADFEPDGLDQAARIRMDRYALLLGKELAHGRARIGMGLSMIEARTKIAGIHQGKYLSYKGFGSTLDGLTLGAIYLINDVLMVSGVYEIPTTIKTLEDEYVIARHTRKRLNLYAPRRLGIGAVCWLSGESRVSLSAFMLDYIKTDTLRIREDKKEIAVIPVSFGAGYTMNVGLMQYLSRYASIKAGLGKSVAAASKKTPLPYADTGQWSAELGFALSDNGYTLSVGAGYAWGRRTIDPLDVRGQARPAAGVQKIANPNIMFGFEYNR